MATRTERRDQTRAQRDESRARILAATRELLDEQPWAAISVEMIMNHVGATRTIFYRSFADTAHVLIALLEEVGQHLQDVGEMWLHASADPAGELRLALNSLVDGYVQHGPVLRAGSVAMDDDPQVASAYRSLADGYVRLVTERIRLDVDAGASDVRDPSETARALVWLNERYLTQSVAVAARTDVEVLKSALGDIWVRTIYPAAETR